MFALTHSMSILSSKEKQVLDSQREIEWLKRKIQQLTEEDCSEEVSIPDSATKENVQDSLSIYKDHVNKMKSELDVYIQYNKSKEEAIKVINEQHHTIDALYPEPSNHHEMKKKKLIEDYINQRDKLVTECLNLLQEYNVHKIELTQIQKEIIQQHLTNREALTKIKSFKQSPSPEIALPLLEVQRS